jgi:hypothetical protein
MYLVYWLKVPQCSSFHSLSTHTTMEIWMPFQLWQWAMLTFRFTQLWQWVMLTSQFSFFHLFSILCQQRVSDISFMLECRHHPLPFHLAFARYLFYNFSLTMSNFTLVVCFILPNFFQLDFSIVVQSFSNLLYLMTLSPFPPPFLPVKKIPFFDTEVLSQKIPFCTVLYIPFLGY